jgi:hypothetical protein
LPRIFLSLQVAVFPRSLSAESASDRSAGKQSRAKAGRTNGEDEVVESTFLDLSLGSLVFDDDALLASLLDANDFVAKVKSDIPALLALALPRRIRIVQLRISMMSAVE